MGLQGSAWSTAKPCFNEVVLCPHHPLRPVCIPGSTNRHTYSAFMAHLPSGCGCCCCHCRVLHCRLLLLLPCSRIPASAHTPHRSAAQVPVVTVNAAETRERKSTVSAAGSAPRTSFVRAEVWPCRRLGLPTAVWGSGGGEQWTWFCVASIRTSRRRGGCR